jgi:hypothetical protein
MENARVLPTLLADLVYCSIDAPTNAHQISYNELMKRHTNILRTALLHMVMPDGAPTLPALFPAACLPPSHSLCT